MKLTNEQRAYLAGLFDGEGCLYISKHKRKEEQFISISYGASAILVQSIMGKEVLEYYQKLIQLGKLSNHEHKNPKHKPYCRWDIGGLHPDQFLDIIEQYLIIKKEQAQLIRKFRDTFHSYDRGIRIVGSGRLPTPDYILEIREYCYQTMKDVKHEYEYNPPPEPIKPNNGKVLSLF